MPTNQAPIGNPRWGRRFACPLPSGPILSEELYVCCIGHAFGQAPPSLELGEDPVYFVQDFLVDQSQSTGGGSFMADPIQFDLTLSAGYVFRILASCGKQLRISLPANVASAYFSACLGRQEVNPPGGVFSATTAQVTFQGLAGTPPTITYNNFSVTQADNSALLFDIEGEIASSVQFDGIIFQANFSRAIDPGAKWYDPLSYAVPFGTADIYPKSETFVLFGYQTSDPVDPGPFVTLA